MFGRELPVQRADGLRMALAFGAAGACLAVLAQKIDTAALAGLPQALDAQSPAALVAALVLTAVSFWAVARYDAVAHRHFRTGIPEAAARRSGFAAIALGQIIGLGVLTGAAVRWRVLADLPPARAMQVSVFVAVSFMLALSYLAAVSLALPGGPRLATLPAAAVVILLPLVAVWLALSPAPLAVRLRRFCPSLRAMGAILGWAALDVLAAGLALYLLIPAGTLDFQTFLPVFLLALMAALLSGAPGGLGPFELTLLSLLPQVPAAELLGGIVVFRAVYYALPASLAVLVLLRPERRGPAREVSAPPAPAPSAEMGVLRQNGGALVSAGATAAAHWPLPQSLVQLFDPLGGTAEQAAALLLQQAAQQNRMPLVYKCSARQAVGLRCLGWRVLATAQDAVIDLRSYDLASPARARLRRALRKAESAGVRVEHGPRLPLSQMARLDLCWQERHGRARGGTMGRFCPVYVARQEVFLAYRHERLIAFATFHRDDRSFYLDLVRHGTDLPDGTMQALVHAAAVSAQAAGLASLSLAGVPHAPDWAARLPLIGPRFSERGLRQFKNGFAPRWQTRYAAAPGPVALVLGLADVAREVHFPAPLPTLRAIHVQDEDYEFAYGLEP